MAGIDQDNAEGEIDHMLPLKESPSCATVQDYKTSRTFHYHRSQPFLPQSPLTRIRYEKIKTKASPIWLLTRIFKSCIFANESCSLLCRFSPCYDLRRVNLGMSPILLCFKILIICSLSCHIESWALFTGRPYCPERLKKLCFTTLDLAVKNLGARLDRKNKAPLVSRDKMAAVWQRPIE